jgi:hypothetical protein
MTQQEHIERNLRLLIGELQVQIIVANARISELLEEAALRQAQDDERGLDIPEDIIKRNGKAKDSQPHG